MNTEVIQPQAETVLTTASELNRGIKRDWAWRTGYLNGVIDSVIQAHNSGDRSKLAYALQAAANASAAFRTVAPKP